MSYVAGAELDFRVAHLSQEPDPSAVTLDSDFPEIQSAVGYWSQVYKYLMWQRIPPGHRVICAVEPPKFSTDLTLARAAAARVSVTYLTTDDAVAVCNRITTALE